MSRLNRMFGKVFVGREGPRGNRKSPSRKQNRRMTMEHMEPRMMMAAPQLTATPYSTTEMVLVWTTVPGALDYAVDYRTIGGAWQTANPSDNSDNLTITGLLNPNTIYQFQVGAQMTAGTKQGAGQATWSNIVTAKTGTGMARPTATAAYSNFGTACYGGSLYGKNGPSYLDVQQGAASDCWLLASLAEVTARDPQDITSMFSWAGTAFDPSNGANVNLYTVRLYNSKGTAEYVAVDSELPAGGATYDHPVNGVPWVALAEKAYAEANSLGYVTTLQPGKNSYAALNGGDPAWALQAITGKPASDFALNTANLATAWGKGQLIVLESDSKPVRTDIVANHCYAMVNYNPSVVSQGKSMPYELFNPWGTNSAGNAPGGMLGLFYADSGVISQNFNSQSIGSGAAPEAGIKSHLAAEAATDLVLATWGM
jgi:hypothetical protein